MTEQELDAFRTLLTWQADLSARIKRARLRFELIGFDEVEQAELEQEADDFKRTARALTWRPKDSDK